MKLVIEGVRHEGEYYIASVRFIPNWFQRVVRQRPELVLSAYGRQWIEGEPPMQWYWANTGEEVSFTAEQQLDAYIRREQIRALRNEEHERFLKVVR